MPPLDTLTLAVVIPTYRRPDDLLRCLAALDAQRRPVDEIVLVVRESDAATRHVIATATASSPVIRAVCVGDVGTVTARVMGLHASTADVIAYIDDDTAPHPDWSARIVAHFASDPRLGGLGGRDWLHENGGRVDGAATTVGVVRWFGRSVGNHHLGVGSAREVDFLKGANMIFRRAALLQTDPEGRLRGRGAEEYDDWLLSALVKRAGWKLVYDPAVGVDHHLGIRWDAPRTHVLVDPRQHFDRGYNEMVAWTALPRLRRAVYVAWSLAVGTRTSPGLVQAIRFTPAIGLAAWTRMLHFQRGKLLALWRLFRGVAEGA
jgi:cellulose synthase/poly-beta-1,6-N-acetylglucosamine synthase-like glycosyltransferase